MTIGAAVLIVIAIIFCLSVSIILLEVLCAISAKEADDAERAQRPYGLRVAVLVPAHNEEDGIGVTVSGICIQLHPPDRLIAIADNCTDRTAERAQKAGAESIVRSDPDRRGKGYALDFGVRYLERDPPDFVVIVDADCRLGSGTIDALVACSHWNGTVAQSFYGMDLPPDADAKLRVAAFAWIVKNHVRPIGLKAIGLPCQLMGSGMAIPWSTIRRIEMATGNIVEDVKMGLDLAALGFAPRYCPEARVESAFPTTDQGFAIQRQRWEAGSAATALKIAPIMFMRGLVGVNLSLMAMAVDLMVPPLMMLITGLIAVSVMSAIFFSVGGTVIPVAILSGSGLLFIVTLSLAWFRFGRHVLRPRDLLALPGVFCRKFGLYLAMWRGRGAGWVRTDRK